VCVGSLIEVIFESHIAKVFGQLDVGFSHLLN